MSTREAARLGIFGRIGIHLDEHLSAWLVIPSTIALCFIWPILAPLSEWHSLKCEEIVLRIAGGLIIVVSNIIGHILSISKQRKVHDLDQENDELKQLVQGFGKDYSNIWKGRWILMATIRDIIGYLCQQYPHKDELSKARLTKMVYLADWKSAIEHRRQMSDIRWIFNHFGPYVDDVINTAYMDEHFNVHDTTNFYGEPKEIISLKKPFVIETLSVEDKKILDFVIKSTCQLTWDDFIRLVYSTFPVFTTTKMEKMDLLHAARRYKDEILTPAMNG